MKKLFKGLLFIFLLGALSILLINLWIIKSTENQVYREISEIPFKEVGLVLGTSRYLVGGNKNPYFYNRLEAAVELYKNKKIKHILLSGDNRTKYYNEPRDMYKVLVDLGVPKEDITLDFAGLRTFDSVVRCKEIFGQQKVTIITQEYHTYRAAFIADYHGLDANCFIANDPGYKHPKKIIYREYLARIKAFLDLYVLNAKPKYLGDIEPIQIQ